MICLMAYLVGGLLGQSTQELFRAAEPAVVRLEIHDERGETTGFGSGFLVSPDGKLITNHHVVKHAKSITVRLANDDAYDGVEVIDVDKRKDIVLLKIKAIDLSFLPLGRSADVKVGDPVFAIGTPLGERMLKNTLSNGIVSGLRPGDGYRLFQVTAPVSEGSSGGPVLNAKGEVIGIVKAGIPEAQNLNFVIPIDYARGMLTTKTVQALSTIYEPPPVTEKPATQSEGGTTPPTEPAVGSTTKEMLAAPKPEEIRKTGLIPFLAAKLYKWTEEEAKAALGDPLLHRYSYDPNKTVDGDIYSYNDPTRTARLLELAFDSKTKRLRWASIHTLPTGNADQAKKTFGDRFQTKKNPDGTTLFLYQDKRLNLLLDKQGALSMIMLY